LTSGSTLPSGNAALVSVVRQAVNRQTAGPWAVSVLRVPNRRGADAVQRRL